MLRFWYGQGRAMDYLFLLLYELIELFIAVAILVFTFWAFAEAKRYTLAAWEVISHNRTVWMGLLGFACVCAVLNGLMAIIRIAPFLWTWFELIFPFMRWAAEIGIFICVIPLCYCLIPRLKMQQFGFFPR